VFGTSLPTRTRSAALSDDSSPTFLFRAGKFLHGMGGPSRDLLLGGPIVMLEGRVGAGVGSKASFENGRFLRSFLYY
jgi:hypothetical protein